MAQKMSNAATPSKKTLLESRYLIRCFAISAFAIQFFRRLIVSKAAGEVVVVAIVVATERHAWVATITQFQS